MLSTIHSVKNFFICDNFLSPTGTRNCHKLNVGLVEEVRFYPLGCTHPLEGIPTSHPLEGQWDTVGKQGVRILLQCFVVVFPPDFLWKNLKI